jgi:SPOR domain
MNAGADEPSRGQGQHMADADFEGLGRSLSQGDPRLTTEAAQRYSRIAGALVSLALVLGLGYWGYRLAVRDVLGVPVIQALDGPMRIAPEDPGGEIADHQGLAVNDVAAVGIAAPLPEKLILAPRPVDLAEEDTPGLAGLAPPGSTPVAAPGEIAPGGTDLALAATPPTESASPTEVAVDAAIAEALGLVPEDVPTATAEEPASDMIEGPVLEDLSAVPEPDGAIAVSPRPKARPDGRAAAVAVPEDLADLPPAVDPATIAVGTRLVQLGTFNTEEEAKVAWVRLQGSFGELMTDKGLVVQSAESGGRTFFRLRAEGFEDEADARRFCAAFVAQDVTCIPVPQR